MTIVAGAVAGDDLQRVAASAADALGSTVAIAIPSRGAPVVRPPASLSADAGAAIAQHAEAVVAGTAEELPSTIADAVPIRIGQEVVGIVAAAPGAPNRERFSWLEAVAAAAAVTAMMRSPENGGLRGSRLALLDALIAGRPEEATELVEEGRRLGLDLGAGAIAICALGDSPASLAHAEQMLVGQVSARKLFALVPVRSSNVVPESVASELADLGMTVGVSTPRHDPEAIRDALREAELLAELALDRELSGQEETYRLLIGVLLRDPTELEQLWASTISVLVAYDAEHDTGLLATLRVFFAHHGSTTETAVAMGLHRHTVGYRLSRVQEVSGLSPYESDGRERLSLGLKAKQIMDARKRLFKPE